MIASNSVCLCCGQQLPPELPLLWDYETHTLVCGRGSAMFTATEARYFDVLYRRRKSGPISTFEELVSAAWADDPDGGPDTISSNARFIVSIREKLMPLGWTITPNQGRPRRGYRLVSTESKKQ